MLRPQNECSSNADIQRRDTICGHAGATDPFQLSCANGTFPNQTRHTSKAIEDAKQKSDAKKAAKEQKKAKAAAAADARKAAKEQKKADAAAAAASSAAAAKKGGEGKAAKAVNDAAKKAAAAADDAGGETMNAFEGVRLKSAGLGVRSSGDISSCFARTCPAGAPGDGGKSTWQCCGSPRGRRDQRQARRYFV